MKFNDVILINAQVQDYKNKFELFLQNQLNTYFKKTDKAGTPKHDEVLPA
ncbi:MAG: hypothetical protein ACR2KB_16345 [Chitinophagaceae bacterium]|jgi:hypothetical protein